MSLAQAFDRPNRRNAKRGELTKFMLTIGLHSADSRPHAADRRASGTAVNFIQSDRVVNYTGCSQKIVRVADCREGHCERARIDAVEKFLGGSHGIHVVCRCFLPCRKKIHEKSDVRPTVPVPDVDVSGALKRYSFVTLVLRRDRWPKKRRLENHVQDLEKVSDAE